MIRPSHGKNKPTASIASGGPEARRRTSSGMHSKYISAKTKPLPPIHPVRKSAKTKPFGDQENVRHNLLNLLSNLQTKLLQIRANIAPLMPSFRCTRRLHAQPRLRPPQASNRSSELPTLLMPRLHLTLTLFEPSFIPVGRTGARTGLEIHTRGLAFRTCGHQPFFCQPEAVRSPEFPRALLCQH